MTVSEPEADEFDLAEVVAEARAAHPPIRIKMPDGQTFQIDPPQFWSDKAADPKVGPAQTAIEIMGAEQFKAFCAAGGSATRLNLVLEAWAKRQGVDLGKLAAS